MNISSCNIHLFFYLPLVCIHTHRCTKGAGLSSQYSDSHCNFGRVFSVREMFYKLDNSVIWFKFFKDSGVICPQPVGRRIRDGASGEVELFEVIVIRPCSVIGGGL
jgi:hypothetical protein